MARVHEPPPLRVTGMIRGTLGCRGPAPGSTTGTDNAGLGMKGTIRYINVSNGMVAVVTEDGAISLFELLSGNAEVGDSVSWAGDYPLGGDTVRNLTQNARLDVFFENHDVPVGQLGRLMGLR